jgi:hypothetical protein
MRHLSLFTGSGIGIPPHQAESRANKSLLRILGNGWVYPLSLLLFQWIAEQGEYLDGRLSGS